MNTKMKCLLFLVQKLQIGEELYPQNKQLLEEISNIRGEVTHERTLRRYLKEIHDFKDNLVVTEKIQKDLQDRKVEIYRIQKKKDISNVIKFFLEEENNLLWVIEMLHKQDPSLLDDLNQEAKKSINQALEMDKGIFLFTHRPLEIFTEDKQKEIFNILKKAVRERDYRTLVTKNEYNKVLKNVKCLKIIYMQNNWYLATEKENKKFKLVRISSIIKVDYAKGVSSNYSSKVLKKYQDFLSRLSDPMTQYGEKLKTATLLIDKSKAKYFYQDSKKFFPTQKFILEHNDGTIEFSIEYTQPDEILPFVKRWIPHIQIISPSKLKKKFQNELTTALNIMSENAKKQKYRERKNTK